MTNTPKYALITGASKGLGKAYALELARMGKNLILVSLPQEGLGNLSQSIRKEYDIDVVFFETDFLQNENIIDLARRVNEKYQLEILINNAGIGGSGRFTDAGTEFLETIIQLNVSAPVILLHELLPNLLKQKKAWVLNVASMASFSPMGFKTVYPASKKFIQHFSSGLREELKSKNISISCVYPGPMGTNSEIQNRIEKYGLWARVILMTPGQVAAKSIKLMFKNKRTIVPGRGNKFYWLLMTLFPPRAVLNVATNMVKKELISEKRQNP
ncbi:MAG: SDR family NAD(P)-dependent oxidoreductase [Bacteroidales bacterium]|nr:SDR family NAD(P)-dependent oxidoreductase [Bacteroidales bacterium]